jgi:hypothetical protein
MQPTPIALILMAVIMSPPVAAQGPVEPGPKGQLSVDSYGGRVRPIGPKDTEPPIIIDRARQDGPGVWGTLEAELQVAGADLVRAGRRSTDLEHLQPFREAVLKWSAQLAGRASFIDLQGQEFPVLEPMQAEDLWARTVDAVVERKLEQLKAAAARGAHTGQDFEQVRRRLVRRAAILGPASQARTGRLERLLLEARARGTGTGLDLVPFELEYTRQRMVQALRVGRARRAMEGTAPDAVAVRVAQLAGRYQRLRASKPGTTIDPVR